MKSITLADVKKLVAKWRKRLALEPQWKIDIAINQSPVGVDPADAEDEAMIYVADGYYYAKITINSYNLTPATLELAVVHELCHVLTWRLGKIAELALDRFAPIAVDEVERAVERISRALVALS